MPEDTLPILLLVRGFQDRGGLPRFGNDANQHRQFQTALMRYLNSDTIGRYYIGRAPRGTKVRILVLEGELSRTESATESSYLCVLRVKEERTGRWVAQWAGVADSYRFLYGNLTGTQGVSVHGLVGELGDAMLSFLCGKGATRTRPAQIVATAPSAEPLRTNP